MDEQYVIKRDGRKEKFCFEKIANAINKAIESTGEVESFGISPSIVNELEFTDGCIDIEKIQDFVETLLMKNNLYETAKAYIKYRENRKRIRENAEKQRQFINNFMESDNTANATIDDNSNVSSHNIAVLNAEIHKEQNKETNLYIWEKKIREMFPNLPKGQFLQDADTILYLHDISGKILTPYCASISLYPFLNNGLKELGGKSATPQGLDSFCGIFINLMFNVSSEYKGAIAAPSMFLILDWYCRKEFGTWYYLDENYLVTNEGINKQRTIKQEIEQKFQQITYSLNQPSGARGNQSIFWNLSFFDKYFFEGMYGTYIYPDGTKPIWDSVNYLQKSYLHWLNQERLKDILTFPVTTCAMIYKDGEFKDKDFFDFVCQEYSEGNSFFTYISDSTDSLSSCCRLRNKITTKEFNFTNGNVGEMTGSKNVITLDINRIVQDYTRTIDNFSLNNDEYWNGLSNYLIGILDRVYKYQEAYNELLWELYNNGMYKSYTAGFISLNRQYLTIGVNGLTAAAECLGIECTPNEEYHKFVECILGTIKEQNAKHKTNKLMFNTELVPAESAAIKLYDRDKAQGFWVPEDINLYTSYMFKPYDESVDIFDKIKLHGKMVNDSLDGGIACHINLAEHLTKEQYAKILNYAGQQECSYLTFNVPNCECKDCGFIKKVPFDKCPRCGSENTIKYDRIIGYLTAIPNWSRGRQSEQKKRVYSKI